MIHKYSNNVMIDENDPKTPILGTNTANSLTKQRNKTTLISIPGFTSR